MSAKRYAISQDVAQAAVEAARAVLLAALDAYIAKAPEVWKPALLKLRDDIATTSTIPAQVVDVVWTALGKALVEADFGPATSSDADTA